MPSSTRARRQEVINALEPLSCEVLSIPGMADLVNGSARIDQLNEVSIDDLLVEYTCNKRINSFQ